MNWEEWFKMLLSAFCFVGFSILSWLIADIKREMKELWGQIEKRQDEMNKLGMRVAYEYVTKQELNEIKREIKSEMDHGFSRITEQIKMLIESKKD